MRTYRFEKARTQKQRLLPWQVMEREGLTRAILWNSLRPELSDWLSLVDERRALLTLAWDGDALAGAVWVLPSGLCGTVHFVMFRAWRSDRVNLGRQAVRFLFDAWPFAALLAAYPAPYRHLDAFVEALGFSPWKERLPLACPMPTKARPEKCADMKLALLCRGEAAG